MCAKNLPTRVLFGQQAEDGIPPRYGNDFQVVKSLLAERTMPERTLNEDRVEPRSTVNQQKRSRGCDIWSAVGIFSSLASLSAIHFNAMRKQRAPLPRRRRSRQFISAANSL